MPIPDFQTLMRPLLEHLSDGADHSNQETASVLADQFHLSEDERTQLLPSGKQSLFTNRVAWAKSHLKQAGLVESPRWGVYRITTRGIALLREIDGPITMKVLSQFPEYQEFRAKKAVAEADIAKESTSADEMTPEEHIEYGYKQTRQKLSIEILDRIKKCPPDFF
jgi:restriction system protein